ncbi:MAG: glycosyltransferase [Bacteroidota bacterium]
MSKVICTVINDLHYDQRMHRICTTLSINGHDVTLVGRVLPSSHILPQQNFKQKRLKCLINKGKLFYIEYNIRLLIYLLFNKFDIINAVDLDTLLAGYWASRLKRKTCVYDAHEYFQEVPEVVSRPNVKRFWETLAKAIIPKLKYCYTVSPGLATIFEAKYNVHFSTVMNVPFKSPSPSVDTEGETAGAHIILYQGALNEGRCIDILITCIGDILNAELWIAGEGDLSVELRALAKTSGNESKIRFLGYVEPTALKTLTKKAYIGFNLLENKGLSYYHSLANKYFDYMHAGLPTVNPDFPEYRALNKEIETAILIDDVTSTDKVAQAINSLIADKTKYQQLRSNCFKAANRFNWDEESKKLINIYKKASKQNI